MHRRSIVIGLVALSAIISTSAFPQQRDGRNGESPVIFIDFNYEGKPGEGKSLRSLDQVAYQDGSNKARSNLKDSYGNPVAYDTLDNVDANKPSNNKEDPNKFVIPGYASGILLPHEVPTRSNSQAEISRKINDDKVHFIDPLQNSFNNDKNAPQSGLSTPLGTDSRSNNLPINIPKPNINLQETPVSPIDDPLNHELHPPQESGQGIPLSSLQTPVGAAPQLTLQQDLIPPQIPVNGDAGSVFIPRPNLDIPETPIDSSNGPLNQGLLPPNENAFKSADNNIQSFAPENQNQNGPVVFTDQELTFAPKPANGLLPPKDPSPNDVDFQTNVPQFPESSTAPISNNRAGVLNKFSGNFGGAPGILGGTGQTVVNKVSATDKFTGSFGGAPGILGEVAQTIVNKVSSSDKFTGSFGGASGVLGSRPVPKVPLTHQTQIPVVVVQSPVESNFGGATNSFGRPIQNQPQTVQTQPQAVPTQSTQSFQFTQSQVQTTANAPGKYQGTFGGSSGVLISDNLSDRVVASSSNTVQQSNLAPAATTLATAPHASKFSFGGPPGVLANSQAPSVQTPTTQTISQLPNLHSDLSSRTNSDQKYSGTFGGSPGVLAPFDNTKN